MKVKTIVNKKALKEIRKHLMKPSTNFAIAVFYILFLALIIISLITKSYYILTISVVGIAAISLEYFIVLRNRIINTNIKRMKELYGESEIEGYLEFEDDEIITTNKKTGGKLKIKYKILDRMIETENYISLLTKQWQLIIIDKNKLNNEEKQECLDIIKEKSPDIKFIKEYKK